MKTELVEQSKDLIAFNGIYIIHISTDITYFIVIVFYKNCLY